MSGQELVEYRVRDRVAEIVMRREPVNAINMELTRAVNAGCGFLCTVHANSSTDAVNALVNAALMAGENVTEHAGDNDMAQSFPARRGQAGGKAEPARLKTFHALSGVQKDWPYSCEGEQEIDRSVTDSEHHHRDRHPRQWRDHPQELECWRCGSVEVAVVAHCKAKWHS